MGRCYYFFVFFSGYAEETFDTHFMIGGMRGEKFPNIASIINNLFRETTNLMLCKPPVAWETRYHDPRVTSQPCLPKVLLTTLGVKTDNLNTKIIVFYWMKRFMVDNISGI